MNAQDRILCNTGVQVQGPFPQTTTAAQLAQWTKPLGPVLGHTKSEPICTVSRTSAQLVCDLFRYAKCISN